jgi:hypothetical protein
MPDDLRPSLVPVSLPEDLAAGRRRTARCVPDASCPTALAACPGSCSLAMQGANPSTRARPRQLFRTERSPEPSPFCWLEGRSGKLRESYGVQRSAPFNACGGSPAAVSVLDEPLSRKLFVVKATATVLARRIERQSLGERVGVNADAVSVEGGHAAEVLAASGAEIHDPSLPRSGSFTYTRRDVRHLRLESSARGNEARLHTLRPARQDQSAASRGAADTRASSRWPSPQPSRLVGRSTGRVGVSAGSPAHAHPSSL